MSYRIYSTIYCIVKLVIVRAGPERDSPVVGEIHFGQKVQTTANRLEGTIKIYYRLGTKGKPVIKGYANALGFTQATVVDRAGLYYINKTGKRIPFANKYQGNTVRYIGPEGEVKVYAVVGKWCLTDQGWTIFGWLEKDRSLFSIECIKDLHYAILARAAEDYCNDVKRLKERKYHDLNEYCDLVADIDKITAWFMERKKVVKGDHVTVAERLKDLNDKMEIDDTWLARKHRVVKVLQKKGLVRKKKDDTA